MAVLVANERVDYNTLRKALELTDGNLASHLKPLESQGFITVHKVFIARKPQTTYAVTALGRKAFQAHLDALEKVIKLGRDEEPPLLVIVVPIITFFKRVHFPGRSFLVGRPAPRSRFSLLGAAF